MVVRGSVAPLPPPEEVPAIVSIPREGGGSLLLLLVLLVPAAIGSGLVVRWGPYRCLTTDSLPRGSLGQYVRASAYAELDGERKRQSIYPGSGPRS